MRAIANASERGDQMSGGASVDTLGVGKRTLVEAAAPAGVQCKLDAAGASSGSVAGGARDGGDGAQRAAIESLFGPSVIARSSAGAGGSHAGTGLRVSQPGDAAEREADRVADAVM